MMPWALFSLTFIGVAVLGRRGMKKRARRRQLVTAKLAKLEELAKGGFRFSRQYDTGRALLLVDEPAGEWAVICDSDPAAARARPFSAIRDCYAVSGSKRHVGVRRVNEAAMLRGGVGAANREVYDTETECGLVIRLQEPEGDYLFVDCLEAEYSAERLQAILLSQKEYADAKEEDSDE